MNSVVIHSERQTYISLYTGGGGLDLAFRRENPAARCILYVERDIEASALLADHIETGLMDAAPIWSDSSTLDCRPFAGKVDWVIGGFPCQPWSFAGKRSTTDDSRWLWPHIERIIREVRPRGLFLENVPGLVRGGLELVLRGLAESGFDAEWGSLKASEVGASHRRDRLFILAYRNDGLGIAENEKIQAGRSSSGDGGERVADSNDSGIPALRHEAEREGSENSEKGKDRSQREPGRHGEELAYSVSERSQGGIFQRGNGQEGWQVTNGLITSGDRTVGAFPPGPDDRERWAEILTERPELSPATAKHPVRRVDDGSPPELARTAQLRILGNGVVPEQAAVAFRLLKERLQ